MASQAEQSCSSGARHPAAAGVHGSDRRFLRQGLDWIRQSWVARTCFSRRENGGCVRYYHRPPRKRPSLVTANELHPFNNHYKELRSALAVIAHLAGGQAPWSSQNAVASAALQQCADKKLRAYNCGYGNYAQSVGSRALGEACASDSFCCPW